MTSAVATGVFLVMMGVFVAVGLVIVRGCALAGLQPHAQPAAWLATQLEAGGPSLR